MTHSIETSGWDNDPSQGYFPTFLAKLLQQPIPIYYPRRKLAPLAQKHNTKALERGPLDMQVNSALVVKIGTYQGIHRREQIKYCASHTKAGTCSRDMLQWNVPSCVSTFRPPLLQTLRERKAYCRKFAVHFLTQLVGNKRVGLNSVAELVRLTTDQHWDVRGLGHHSHHGRTNTWLDVTIGEQGVGTKEHFWYLERDRGRKISILHFIITWQLPSLKYTEKNISFYELSMSRPIYR